MAEYEDNGWRTGAKTGKGKGHFIAFHELWQKVKDLLNSIDVEWLWDANSPILQDTLRTAETFANSALSLK